MRILTLAIAGVVVGVRLANAQQPRLIAEPIAGAVRLPNTADPKATPAFLSQKPLAAVRQHYEKTLKRLASARPDGEVGAMVVALDGAALEAEMRKTRIAAALWPNQLGVTLEEIVVSPAEQERALMQSAAGSVFAMLQTQVAMGSRTAEELQGLKQQHARLAKAFYLPAERPNERGRPQNRGEAIAASCVRSAQGGMSEKDVLARAQTLIQQGKVQEAAQLAQRTAGITNPQAQWDAGVTCLREMDAAAFMTKLTIDLHPSAMTP